MRPSSKNCKSKSSKPTAFRKRRPSASEDRQTRRPRRELTTKNLARLRRNHIGMSRAKAQRPPRGSWSFRPKGEIFLRSLTFVRDDGAWPVTLRSWRLSAKTKHPIDCPKICAGCANFQAIQRSHSEMRFGFGIWPQRHVLSPSTPLRINSVEGTQSEQTV